MLGDEFVSQDGEGSQLQPGQPEAVFSGEGSTRPDSVDIVEPRIARTDSRFKQVLRWFGIIADQIGRFESDDTHHTPL
jgi:hypothetical protein